MPSAKPPRAKLKQIKLLLLDVDGVMTDGGIYFSERGDELKKFNILDGYGIMKLQRQGVRVAIITGRVSQVVARRAEELGISEVHQNLENKLEAYDQVKKKFGLRDVEIAYIGDDEPDIPVMKSVGFSACPANAVAAVRREAKYVCRCRGGEGAVREVIDLVLGSRTDRA